MPVSASEPGNPRASRKWTGYAVAVIAVAALAGGLVLLKPIVPLGRFPMPYIVVTMVMAYAFGLGPALVACVLSWLVFVYLFLPPIHAFDIAHDRDGWARQIAFVLGVLIISLAASEASKANRRIAERTAQLEAEMGERERAQDALRQSEERFRVLFQSLPVGALLFDPDDLGFVLFNDEAPRIMGYTRDEFAKLRLTDVEALHDEALIRENVSQMVHGRKLKFETAFRAKTGELRDIMIHAMPLDIFDRRLILSIQSDITERKQAEDALRDSEERFRELFHSLPVGSFLLDPENLSFVLFNETAPQILGYTHNEFASLKLTDIEAVHSEDLIRENMARMVRGERLDFETKYRTKTGELRDILIRAMPLDVGARRLVFTTLMDITERKQAEEEVRQLNADLEQRVIDRTAALNTALQQERTARTAADAAEAKVRQFLEMAPDGIMIAAENGAIRFANNKAIEMFGYEKDELLDADVEQLIPQRFRESHVKHRAEYAENPRTRSMGVGLDLYGRRKDGTEFPVEIALSPTWSEGELTVTAIIRDITERKRAEEQIRMLNEDLNRRATDLEMANKELEAFSYSVSHDLRAPLRAIDGFSNALLKYYLEVLDERGKDYLQRVRTAAQRMAQLIDDILGLSRATRAEMHLRQVDLSAIASEILEELSRSHPERKAEIVVQQGLSVSADEHLLRIVLDNLLGNAWKFTGYRELARIEVGAVEQNTERVFYVRDNGAGFSPDYADKLFSPFQRLHSEAEFPGTGIGLALVQRILRRHGGRIWAESEVGEGATFFLTLEEAET